MASIHNIQEARKKQRQKRSYVKWKKRGIGLLIVLLFGFVGWIFYDKPIAEMIGANMAASKQVAGFPKIVEDNYKEKIFLLGGKICVLTNTRVYVFNSDGREYLTFLHGQSNPVVRGAGSAILYYTPGSSIVHVQSIYGPAKTHRVEGEIQSADLSPNGNLAIAYHTARGVSKVDVYVGNTVLQWQDGDQVVSGVRFAKDQKGILINMYQESGGQLASNFKLFYDRTDPEQTWSLTGTLTVEMEPFRGSFLILGGDGAYFLAPEGNVLATYAFEGRGFGGYRLGEGDHVALLLDDFKAFGAKEILVLDRDLEVVLTLPFDQPVDDFRLAGNTLYVLSDGKIRWFNMEGEVLGEIAAPEGSFQLQALGRNAYVLTERGVEELPFSGETAEGLSQESGVLATASEIYIGDSTMAN